MSETDFPQSVYEALSPALPDAWDAVVFYAEYFEGSFSIEFHIRDAEGRYTKCYDLPGVDEDALLADFLAVNTVIRSHRDTLADKDLWTTMTMVIRHTGEVTIDYDYSDAAEDGFTYRKAWKQRYLV